MRCIGLALALAVIAVAAAAQAQKPAFEVGSIKLQPWTNEGRVGVFIRGNTLTGEHVDLYRLVEFAYGLRTDGAQLSGGPGWALWSSFGSCSKRYWPIDFNYESTTPTRSFPCSTWW